jgi:M6 family metalloprotease-like protein
MNGRRMNCVLSAVTVLFLSSFMIPHAVYAEMGSTYSGGIAEQGGRVSKPAVLQPRPNKKVHMLVAFTKFKNEAPADSLAPEWASRLFDNEPGSVSHYWDEISFGQISASGEYLPKRYILPQDSSYYVNNMEKYVEDMIALIDIDPSVNYSLFDNDGADGIPGSGDDDGYVDYLVLMPMSRPYNFIEKYATGYGNLGEIETYETMYVNSNGDPIKIDTYSGCIVTVDGQNQAIGTLCHEFGHSFGAVDLYDLIYDSNETDSAGIGNWGIMGLGSLGWNYQNGPAAPSAYSRMIFGCIGQNNANLIDIYGMHRDLRIGDTSLESGKVYRIWAGYNEYFLIEHRRNDGIYYDSQVPANGLLIWHVYENVSSGDELLKRCDLECPDGRFSDAGYPLGTVADPLNGGDNLDFWAHDSNFAAEHAGNLGDATDVFDGVKYTRFGPDTNPDTSSKVSKEQTGIEIFNIRPDGNDMLFDVNIPPFTDWISNRFHLIGTGYQRFMGNWQIKYPAQKQAACYLINYENSLNSDRLITVYEDSLTVDDISSLTDFEVQKTIELRMFQSNTGAYSVQLVRENISYNAFGKAIDELGLNPSEIAPDALPEWIQKISISAEEFSLPETINISQNYPNPFNSLTTVSYTLPAAGQVSLEVFNIIGQKVLEDNRGFKNAGSHSLVFDAESLSTGIYLYRISGTTVSETKKLLLIR